ncbi:hemerythrin domain-containing protein [Paenibacillus thailandensis]|uniref:Hemerythrin domain-containing protein n=1 Tax=Paenibacillus thailandensis TaxID=393250 RepID=A0ABW5QZ90_9BACL
MLTQTKTTLLDFYDSYDQWKEEREALQERLRGLCRYMRLKPDRDKPNAWSELHLELREQFLAFMKDWQRYIRLERSVIYPVAARQGGTGQNGAASVLKEDDRLAAEFYEAYLSGCREGATDEEALDRMFQSLMIIAEHLRIEDETVVPQTERLMDEIAYNGS